MNRRKIDLRVTTETRMRQRITELETVVNLSAVETDAALTRATVAEAQIGTERMRIKDLYIDLELKDARIDKLEDENKALREALKEARDDFDSAAEGHGVNFYQCAEDISKALQEQGE